MKEIQVQAPVSKQAYVQPKLVKHGRVEELTQLIQYTPSCPIVYNDVK